MNAPRIASPDMANVNADLQRAVNLLKQTLPLPVEFKPTMTDFEQCYSQTRQAQI